MQTYANELAREEVAHVTLLFNTLRSLGMNPKCPLVNLDTAFEAAAEAALGTNGVTLTPVFDGISNDIFFLAASFLFEDLGGSAYLGGVNLTQDATFRIIAAQIGNEESYHSGAIRLLAYMSKDASPYYGKTVLEVTTGIANAKNKLANASLTYPITTSQGSAFANGDSSALIPVATFKQVLTVATLGAANYQGGFFPNGTNGQAVFL